MYDNENPIIDVSYSSSLYSPEPEIKKGGNGAGKVIAIILTAALVGAASGFGGAYIANSQYGTNSSQTASQGVDILRTEVKIPSDIADSQLIDRLSIIDDPNFSGQLSTAQIIAGVAPSVVAISTTFSDGTGGGTGIVLTPDGYIVTNAHVIKTETRAQSSPYSSPFGGFFGNYSPPEVETAKEVTVITHDEKEYKAKVIGADTATDLAIIKIDAKDLIPAKIGDSNSLILGEKAITLGYPLGLGLSASGGMISGLDKKMNFELMGGGTTEMTLIQTDAAVNPGNSGGPLINGRGEVVGITSSKLVYSSIEGIGFAIPITDAMPLLQELIDKGFVTDTRPKLGIVGENLESSLITQRYHNLPFDKGVIVTSVEPGAAADKAGIKPGDIIVGADGEAVENMADLVKIRDFHKAGDTMIITLARAGGNVDIKVKLGGHDNN
ncbi:MAG: trypsin-like peptidase domain-containing protein [Oscillospiraceae bacterium]|nr:trypsin-like peptidase domain-containing protein [Oscillospiraceae bacterium]